MSASKPSIVNAEFIERCQLEYEKNPHSKVFAPLAEAYRKMGLVDEANRICKRGVQRHPDFSGGRVAYAKVLLDLKAFPEALLQLERAVELSPDNLLAHSLMGETLIELRRPREALKAYKMVLFLNPSDERARLAVRKWEFLTADEYDEEVFQMRPLFGEGKVQRREDRNSAYDHPSSAGYPVYHEQSDLSSDQMLASGQRSSIEERLDDAHLGEPGSRHAPVDQARGIERAISLADAYTVRNDLVAALDVLDKARAVLGPAVEIDNRRALLIQRLQALGDVGEEDRDLMALAQVTVNASPRQKFSHVEKERRRDILEDLLHRINVHRLGG